MFKFKVHNKDYQLAAGRSAKMPGYIAWVYVYNMAVQLAQADNKFSSWNEEGFRKQYYEKAVSGVEPLMQTIEIEEQPLVETLDDEPLDIEEGQLDEPVSSKVAPMKPKVATSGRSPSRA